MYNTNYIGKYAILFAKQKSDYESESIYLEFNRSFDEQKIGNHVNSNKYYYYNLLEVVRDALMLDDDHYNDLCDHMDFEVYSTLLVLRKLYNKKHVKNIVVHTPFVRVNRQGYPFVTIFCSVKIKNDWYFMVMENASGNLEFIDNHVAVDEMIMRYRESLHLGYHHVYNEENINSHNRYICEGYIVNKITSHYFGIDFEKVKFWEVLTIYGDIPFELNFYVQSNGITMQSTGYTLYYHDFKGVNECYCNMLFDSVMLIYKNVTNSKVNNSMHVDGQKHMLATSSSFKDSIIGTKGVSDVSLEIKANHITGDISVIPRIHFEDNSEE